MMADRFPKMSEEVCMGNFMGRVQLILMMLNATIPMAVNEGISSTEVGKLDCAAALLREVQETMRIKMSPMTKEEYLQLRDQIKKERDEKMKEESEITQYLMGMMDILLKIKTTSCKAQSPLDKLIYQSKLNKELNFDHFDTIHEKMQDIIELCNELSDMAVNAYIKDERGAD